MTITPARDDLGLSTSTLIVRPRPLNDVAEGFRPDSEYVETFWLGVLGPTATWLLRRFCAGLDAYPEGYELDLAQTALSLGTTFTPGKSGPFSRAVDRCVLFGMAERGWEHGVPALAVRRVIPALPRRRVERLPDFLRAAHAAWIAETANS